ncbi:MAG: FISUMP domain-containing protein [Bacteroidota bacterium]|nr:FISUMP domain-containing protein [Bacteroidota bacterium]
MRKYTLLFVFVLLVFSYASGQATINAGNDTTICYGGMATLSATVTGGSYGTESYSFQTIPYNPMPFTGGQAICFYFSPENTHCGSTEGGKDDCWAGPFDIGFSFCFFNATYTQFWVGSNGWISFTDPAGHPWTTFTARPLPDNNPDDETPKNAIFFPWEDWLPCLPSETNIYYYNSGTAPNRKLVVYWKDCPFFGCRSSFATFQVVINEQSSIIENNIQNKPQCGSYNSTQGVQNINGTAAFTAFGRNCTQWTASNESTRFVPSGVSWWIGGYPGGTLVSYGSPSSLSPSVTTTYTAVVHLCNGATATDTKTVFVENPTFNYPAFSYCQSDTNPVPSITTAGGIFTSSPSGLNIDPSTGVINLSGSTPGTYGINYTLSTPYTCVAAQSVTINAVPTAPVPVDSIVTHCGPGNVTMSVVSTPNVAYTWWDSPAGGTQYPFSGSSVTTNVSTNTDFYISALDTNTNCQSLTRAVIHAIVNSYPDVIFNPSSTILCSGQPTNIQLTSSASGATFAWTATPSSSDITGFTSPGSGNSITDVLSNSGTVAGTVIYSVFPTANGCTSPTSVNYTVTVNPLPTVTLDSLNPVCINIPPFTLTGGLPAGGSYSGPGVSGGVFNPAIAGTGTHIITYTYTNSNNCTGTDSKSITVHAAPVVTISPLTPVCINASPFALTGGLPSGGTYSGSGVSGNTFDPAAAGTGIHTITYTYTNSDSCTNSASNTIQVNPLPVVTFAVLNPVCVNASPFLLSGGAPTGGTYSGPGVTGNIFNPANAGPGTFTITYTYINANGCSNSVTQNITVNPLPAASGSISGLTGLCQASTGTAYSVKPIPDAVSYSWSLVPTAAGTINGNTSNITIDWASGFTGSANLFTMGVNNCGNGGSSPAFPITVNPNPIVTYTVCTDTITTLNAQPIRLRGGLPLNGTYSGTGVTANIFYPALAGTGNHPITYSYINTFSCSSLATRNIRVISAPAFFCGNMLTDIRDNKQYPTVLIGSQCWMAANLNYGNVIASSVMQRDNCIPEKYCYNDNPAVCSISGGLYQWDEMMRFSSTASVQGLCPPGWHVPAENDWLILFSNFTNSGFAGDPLKYTGFSGFNALLSGVRFNNNSWNFSNFAIMYWTSTSHGPTKAWAHGMNEYNPSVSEYPSNRSNAFPVRCIKD